MFYMLRMNVLMTTVVDVPLILLTKMIWIFGMVGIPGEYFNLNDVLTGYSAEFQEGYRVLVAPTIMRSSVGTG